MSDIDQTPTSITPIERTEHRQLNGVGVKAVTPYVFDTVTGSLGNANGGLLPLAYDSIQYTNSGITQDTYQFFSGGLLGTLVSTLTIAYTDATKSQISTVVRT